MFFEVDDGKLYLINNPNSSDLTLNYFLFVPQGWTLGLELSFYLIAPLIIKKGTSN